MIKMIEYYNAQPFVFNGFMDVPRLTCGDMWLECVAKTEAIPEKGWVPAYEFAIMVDGARAGELRLRIGYSEHLFYSGQVGFIVDGAYRGRGLAVRATRLIATVARWHGMQRLLITNDDGNHASYKVCEKLGARLIGKFALPDWHDVYAEGHRYMNIFEWELSKN